MFPYDPSQPLIKVEPKNPLLEHYIRTLVGTPFWAGFLGRLFGGRILTSYFVSIKMLPYMRTRNE